MNSNDDFINGVWKKANLLEYEEKERAKCKARNKLIRKNRVLKSLLFLVVFLFCLFSNELIKNYIYILIVIIPIAVFIYEEFKIKENVDGNNCR